MDPHHLLIVDDEGDFREALSLLLGFEGFRVSQADGGHAALAMMESGLRPDLLLLDYRMPGLTGAETLDRLRARGFATPAVLVTAARDGADIAARHGFTANLTKPCGPEQLLATVRAIVGQGLGPRGRETPTPPRETPASNGDDPCDSRRT